MKVTFPAAIFLVTLSLHAQEFLIVASRETKIDRLSLFQLQQIYLGRLDQFENQKITPLQLKTDDRLRKVFEAYLFGGRLDLEDYWIQQKLRAGADPPVTVGNWSLLLLYVNRNPGYIGYIDKAHAHELKRYRLKIIPIHPVD